MTYYERALPHWQPEGAAIFLTWRLHGSLPKEYFESHRDPNPAREFVRQEHLMAQKSTLERDSEIEPFGGW